MNTIKDIVGYEGRYQITSDGKVISTERLVYNGTGRRKIKQKELKLTSDKDGYKRVHLRKIGVKAAKTHHLHKLLAEAFIPKPSLGCFLYVDHINRNIKDNRIENLRWTTCSKNIHNGGEWKINKSGRRGVSFIQRKNLWQAQICIKEKQKHLGYFKTFEEAVAAREKAEKNFSIVCAVENA